MLYVYVIFMIYVFVRINSLNLMMFLMFIYGVIYSYEIFSCYCIYILLIDIFKVYY